MVLEMLVPSPGESISEVEIAEWLVEDGEYVEKDQAIAEIDSDKATLELPAEKSGTIKIIVEEGETVAVGDVVCLIDTNAAQPGSVSNKDKVKDTFSSKSTSNNKAEKKVKLTPLADAMIKKNNLDQNNLKGSGEDGKITKIDVLEMMNSSSNVEGREHTSQKMSSLRRKIATRLVAVKNETAMLTTFNEVDMSSIMKIRSEFKQRFIEKHDINLGFMSFFTKACCVALKDWPAINAKIDGDEVIYSNFCDVSIAVSAPKGLVVPVIRNAETLSFEQI